MLIDQSRVIVEDGMGASCGTLTKQVHHGDFPEIRAECGSVVEGVAYLASRLSRARESVGSAWHREVIDQAIADVAAFRDTLAEAGQGSESSCRCGTSGPGPLAATTPEPGSSRWSDAS